MNEENQNVQAACKNSLRDLAPLFRSQDIQELFASSTLDPNRTLDYVEFLNDLSIRLVDFLFVLEKCISHSFCWVGI